MLTYGKMRGHVALQRTVRPLLKDFILMRHDLEFGIGKWELRWTFWIPSI